MARYDFITYHGEDSTESEQCLNLTHSVGFGGVNRFDDVLLIQAMFQFIAKYGAMGPKTIGLGREYNVPKVTGTIDNDTSSAIAQFQIEWSHDLLIARFDGRIDEAHYQNRKIPRMGKVMSITLLHFIMKDIDLIRGGNYIKDIEKTHPFLAHAFDMDLLWGDKFDGLHDV